MHEPPMPETSDPYQKPPLKRWHIIVEVIICALVFASVLPHTFMILFPLVLIPAAVAFPIIVGKPDLLFIPMGVAGFVLFVIWPVAGYWDFGGAIFAYIVVAIIGLFGLVPGGLVRGTRRVWMPVRIITAIIAVIILFIPFLFVFEFLTGTLNSRSANRRIRSYVAQHYSDFDLTIHRISYDFKGGTFRARIYDSNNPAIYFHIFYRGGRIDDGFTAGSFWVGTLEHMIAPLLQEEFGDEVHRFSSSVGGVRVGQQFDLDADVTINIWLTATAEATDPQTLSAQISGYHEFFVQNGFNFNSYNFTFRHDSVEQGIHITVIPELVNNELPSLIEYARYNRNDSGVFFNRETRFRYSSRVGLP